MTVLLSTCLVGINTQWDGGSCRKSDLVELVRSGRAVFLCPEQLGGLTTPRAPAEIEPGRTAREVLAGEAKVLTDAGQDVTEQFVSGAQEVLALCQEIGINVAVLKATSPSCGSSETYDGTFTLTLRPGRGITTELLALNGIKVYNEENYPDWIAVQEQPAK